MAENLQKAQRNGDTKQALKDWRLEGAFYGMEQSERYSNRFSCFA